MQSRSGSYAAIAAVAVCLVVAAVAYWLNQTTTVRLNAALLAAQESRAQAETSREQAESARRRAEEALAHREARRLSDERGAQAKPDPSTRPSGEQRERADLVASLIAPVDPGRTARLLDEIVQRFAEEDSRGSLDRSAEPSSQRVSPLTRWQRANHADAARMLIDRMILQPAIDVLDDRLKDEPVLDAALRQALADRYQSLGMYAAAMPLQERALLARRRHLGNEHPDTLISINNMGALLVDQGRLREAEPYYREDVELSRRRLGAAHPDTLIAEGNLGALLRDLRRYDEAEPLLRQSVDLCRRTLGPRHAITLGAISNLAVLLHVTRRLDEAESLYREALESTRGLLGADHPDAIGCLNNLASLHEAQGRLGDAEARYAEALERFRRAVGAEHAATLGAAHNLGNVRRAQGRFDQAATVLLPAAEIAARALPPQHETRTALFRTVVRLYEGWDRAAPGEGHAAAAAAWRAKLDGPPAESGGD